MKKWLALLAIIVIAIVGIVWFQMGTTPDEIPRKTLYHILPDNPSLLVENQNLRDLPRTLSEIDLIREFRDSPYSRFYRTRVRPMMKAMQNSEQPSLQRSIRHLQRFTGDRALLFAQETPFHLVAAINLRTPDTTTGQSYRELDDFLRQHFVSPFREGKELNYEKITHRGVTIHQFQPDTSSLPVERQPVALEKGSLSVARLHNHLLLGIGPTPLTTVIDRYANRNSAPAGLFEGEDTPDQYEVRYHLKPSLLLAFYQQLEEQLPEETRQQNPYQYHKDQIRGFNKITGSLREQDGLLHIKTQTQWDAENTRKSLAYTLKQSPEKLEFTRYLPPQTIIAQNQLIPRAEEQFRRYQNQVLRPAIEQDTAAESDGSDWLPTQGIFPFLEIHDTEFGWGVFYNQDFFQSLYKKPSPTFDGFPVHGLVGFEIGDMPRLNQALEMLQSNPFLDYDSINRKLHIDFILGELPLYLRRDQSFLLVGSSPEVVNQAIRNRQQQSGLASQPQFRRLRNKLPTRLNVLSYFSGEAFTNPLQYRWLEKYVPDRSAQIETVAGFDPIREIHRVARRTKPSMAGVWNRPDQHRVEASFYSSGDLILPVVTMGVVGGAYAYFQPGLDQFRTSDTNEDNQEEAESTSTAEGQQALSAAIYE